MKRTRCAIILIVISYLQLFQFSYSQTYISDSLKSREEKHIQSKDSKIEKVETPSTFEKAIIVPFDETVLSEKSYFMTSFEVVSTTDNETKASFDDYFQQVKSKFEHVDLIIDFENSQIHFVDKVTREFNSSPFTQSTESTSMYLLISGCKDCNELKIQIEYVSLNELIIKIPSQDEDDFFSTIISLKTKL